MNKTVLKFGLFALITAALLFITGLILGKSLPTTTQEIFGYTSILVSLSFVYFGIKSYRDKENAGQISFAKALGIGLLISVFAGLGIGLIDALYTTVINPDFATDYATMMKEQGFQDAPVYSSFNMALLMFTTVVIIGFIVSLISAMVLKKSVKA